MLSVLKIKNVALIDDLTIEFGDKLNIISGETGSGKSIMLDSCRSKQDESQRTLY